MLRGKLVSLIVFCLVLFSGFPAAALGARKNMNETYADVSMELLGEVSKKGKDVLISPVSILAAVNMAENGAAGATKKEFVSLFGGNSVKETTKKISSLIGSASKSERLTFRSPCSIWYKDGAVKLKSGYVSKMTKSYNALIRAGKFDDSTVREVNAWVSEQTNGKIPSIVDRLDERDRLILVNATYFKGGWAEPYERTQKRKFTKSNGKKKTVEMLEGAEKDYLEIDGAKGFVKYYEGGSIAFVGILPPKGMTPETFVKKVSGSRIRKAFLKRERSGVIVQTRMPKFEYSFETSLVKPLQKMGLKKAFTWSADFSGMTATPVYIDEILHKTYIALDENGTEAAAVTGMFMKANSALVETRKETVYLDRPFLYQIVDVKTGLPLFAGIVNDP